jgi:hypothetical protein
MANSRDANAFVSSFMQGFSFVDDINSRKRREDMLEQRLAEESEARKFQRQRLTQIDAERGADRASRLTKEQRAAEANRLLAADASDEELQPFADFPAVGARITQRRNDAADQADLGLISRGEGLTGAVGAGVTQDEVPPSADPNGLTGAVQPAPIPGNEFDTPEKLTDRELNELANTDPAGAAQVRDQQRADVQTRRDAQNAAGPTGIGGPGAPVTTDAEKAATKRRAQQDQVNTEWDIFLDINDVAGDALRNLDPNLITAKYFDDRGNINDPQMRDQLDKRMAPHIQTTIGTQQEVLAGVDPQSPEARNARRKLGEAYGLANEIGVQYEPLRQNGVDARGLPTNGGNQALTDAVVNSVSGAPGMSLPPDPNMTRADQTIINRGTSGRVSERFSQAAFRQFKNGRINFAQYDSLIRTGRLPQVAPTFEQTDPKKDTWRVDANGNRQLIIPARHVPTQEELESNSRNLINKDGLAHLNRISGAYDTPDDPVRGTRLVGSFINALAGNERRAMQGGYDLSTVNDVGALYQRWVDLHVLRDAYNDEWFADGRFNPDFTEEYGTLDTALFDPRIDELAAGGELEVPGTTTFGLGGDNPGITPTKARDPAVYDAIRQQFPEFAQADDNAIEAAIQAQEN